MTEGQVTGDRDFQRRGINHHCAETPVYRPGVPFASDTRDQTSG